jgi:hypothetical protein
MSIYAQAGSRADAPILYADSNESGSALEPLCVLPEQIQHRSAASYGVPALMYAILDDAIGCVQKPVRNRRSQRLAREAEEWIFADDEVWPFSFVNICAALDLDPDSVRVGLRRLSQRSDAAGASERPRKQRIRATLRTAQIAA